MNPSVWRGHTQDAVSGLRTQEGERIGSSSRGPDRPISYPSQASTFNSARHDSGNHIVPKSSYSPPAPQRIVATQQGQPMRSQPGARPVSTQDGKLTGDLDAGLMSVLNDIKKELNDAKKLSSLSKSIDGNSSANAARTESNPTSSGVTRAAAPPLGSMPYASQPNPYARSELRTFQPEQPRPPQYQPSAPRPAASDALRSQASTNRQSMASSEESQDFAASLQKLRARLADVNTPTSNNTSSNQTPRTNASLFNSSPSLPTAPRASSNGQSSVEVPRDSPPPAPGMVKAKLPPGWEMKLDTASGKIFYVNHGLKAISWERPTDNWGAAKQQTTNQAPALRSELPSAASQPAGPNSARGRQDPRQSRASPPDPQPGVPLMAPPEPRP
eukprot:CAMPEP_0177700816 /NCGR_PEP_ID=MMETSP0484_2-20121128/6290_1 /TAXON_ID=354590 /ORGANISM="Rhodomonas lens, Strain RHODO" /LENGTH=386 /DNA_ID=CAMNT_0019212029 /DNA_START=118 /DNA_END=1275 /DNA_ORIENTATION=-